MTITNPVAKRVVWEAMTLLEEVDLNGKRKLRDARPNWERAQALLEEGVGRRTWNQLSGMLTEVAEAAGKE